jgi:3-isopropylmalate/(R)-2-methylmalate dehydratase small subunit
VIRRGRAWVFGDSIDTDVMMPGRALRLSPEEGLRYLFDAIRGEGWADEVREGDVLVGGHHFGAGSARPVANLLRAAGVGAIVAESMPSLFQRNCVNAGLLAVTAAGVTALVREGEEIEIDTEAGTARNLGSDRSVAIVPMPAFVTGIVEAGGVIAQLEAAGYFAAAAENGSAQ